MQESPQSDMGVRFHNARLLDFYSIVANTEKKIFSKKKKRGSERVSKIIQDASSCTVNVISFGHCKHLIL